VFGVGSDGHVIHPPSTQVAHPVVGALESIYRQDTEGQIRLGQNDHNGSHMTTNSVR